MKRLISYLTEKHILTNLIALGVLLGGTFFWIYTPKQELPDIDLNYVSISSSYPGASPEEVEHFLTKPIEDEIKGIDGIYRVTSTSTVGSSSVNIEIDDDVENIDPVVNEINDSVNRVTLPSEVRNDPVVKRFKVSQKAIIDIAIINTKKEILSVKDRQELQNYALTLEQQLLSLQSISSVRRQHYLKNEIQIKTKPDKLLQYEIPLSTVKSVINVANVREPAGNIEDLDESKVTLNSELNTVDKLKRQIIRGGFEGQEIRLSQVADVVDGFEKNTSIVKVNGHEGIIFNVVKTSSSGIIKSVDKVKEKVELFKKHNLKNSHIKIQMLDDESSSVRERLSLIGINGAIGFVLILITLFIFLNVRAGIWVAMGIPFSFCFTMIVTYMMGYTINNITLAAVIIVMGMIVDDAIVVAENISRLKSEGMDSKDAAVKGTVSVFTPIVASIITTCVAFLPMLFFKGRFAKFISYIPPVVSIMLMGSLIESIFILPGHMNLHIPAWFRNVFTLGLYPLSKKIISYFKTRKESIKKNQNKKLNQKISEDPEKAEYRHWFHAIEDFYSRVLEKVLDHKYMVFLVFILLFIFSGYIFSTNLKFVMFPDEEATQIVMVAEAPEGTKRYETARLAGKVERIFAEYFDTDLVGFRTTIARSRHGRVAEENKFTTRIELISRENRKKSLKELKAEWKLKLAKVKGINEIKFRESRFGQSSGSPIDIMIQETDDNIRNRVIKELYDYMVKIPDLESVEVDRPMFNPEYKIDLNRDKITRLDIAPSEVSGTLRAVLQGTVLYEFFKGDEEVDVRLTSIESAKSDINKVLKFPVENSSSYLVPLKDLININRTVTPYSIFREDYKRTTKIFADIRGDGGKKSLRDRHKLKSRKNKKGKPAAGERKSAKVVEKQVLGEIRSPLEIAEHLEATIIPELNEKYPTTIISFVGEIKDSRESKGDFAIGVIVVLFLIYSILAVFFNSMLKPFIIMLTIPFGLVGIILAFWLHGIPYFGFFAVVGAIGLAGVVVNDSIVMLHKLENEYDLNQHREFSSKQVAEIAKTRLRAVLLTTFTTVAGLLPTAYGVAGYDSMLAEMMFSMSWGLLFATFITLILVPSVYSVVKHLDHFFHDPE